jgi:hypothetical protein
MSDAKKELLPPVKLVAIERAFRDGELVEPGTTFWFDPNPKEGDRPSKLTPDGKQRRIPKWAAPAGTPMPVKRAAGDLKPTAAQAAVKRKAGAMTGSSDPA